jgi:hypothetical protein
MSSQRKHSAAIAAAFLLVLSFLLYQEVRAQDEPVKLINEIPKHLPLKIEIENADKEDLLQGLRIKVTNESDKPIYYLRFFLEVADVEKTGGLNVAENMWFGRLELGNWDELASENDASLKKGESTILKVPNIRVKGFDKMLKRYSFTKPKIFKLRFGDLNYGDGTGYHTLGGQPYPEKILKTKND